MSINIVGRSIVQDNDFKQHFVVACRSKNDKYSNYVAACRFNQKHVNKSQ